MFRHVKSAKGSLSTAAVTDEALIYTKCLLYIPVIPGTNVVERFLKIIILEISNLFVFCFCFYMK